MEYEIGHVMEYKRFDRLAADITRRLRNKVAKEGYYENLGERELRSFKDKLEKSILTYPEKSTLVSMLTTSIRNI